MATPLRDPNSWSPGDGQVARSRPRFTPQALFGVIVIILGILFTLDNLNVIDATDYLQYWPAGLVAVGSAQVVAGARRAGGRRRPVPRRPRQLDAARAHRRDPDQDPRRLAAVLRVPRRLHGVEGRSGDPESAPPTTATSA